MRRGGTTDPIARIILFLGALGLAAACASTPRSRPPDGSAGVFPAANWQHVDPAAAGYCSDRLDLVTARAKALPTTALMVIAGGRVLYEYGDVRRVSYVASIRKSILAMLFGKHVESGRIALDRTLAQLGIDDRGGLSHDEKQATVADLLTARSGVYHEASNSGDDLADAPARGSQQHGRYFLYSNWDFNALGTIFEQETGENIYDALERDLARPIGLQDFDRSTHRRSGDASRSIHLAYHMNLSTRDMARVGYVMLRDGDWNGRRIVPRAWVRRIVMPVTRVHEMNPARYRTGAFGYGYLWWIWDGSAASNGYAGAYTGIGAFGQFITVLPKLDLVIAHKTVPGHRSVSPAQYLELVERLISARCS